MLLGTPQMLKKSKINKNCAEKQRAVRSRDATGGKEPTLIVVSWRKTLRSLSLLYWLPYPPPLLLPKNIFSYFEQIAVFFCSLLFLKILIKYILLIIIIIIRCSGMFRNVPECSEMFHVPGFIDGPFSLKVTMHLQGCLACKRCSASGLNCSYLNPYIKLKLIGLAIRLYQTFWKKMNFQIFHDS